jgi:hypothetical protein
MGAVTFTYRKVGTEVVPPKREQAAWSSTGSWKSGAAPSTTIDVSAQFPRNNGGEPPAIAKG